MPAEPPHYNVLFIVSDQEYAHQALPEGISLPNHERLMASGVSFENHQVTTTVCTPSRSVMLTGQHTPHTGMWDNTNMAWISEMNAAIPTVGHMLREAGYYTAFKGKWHLSEVPNEGSGDALEPYGFADFQNSGDIWGEPLDGYRKDPEVADEAARWLRVQASELAGSQPWFLAVNFVNPHDVMFFDADGDPRGSSLFPLFPAPDAEPYTDQLAVELPATFDDDLAGEPEGVQDYAHLCDVSYGELPKERTDLWLRHINYYVNCIRDLDRHLGTVLDALEESGEAENTIVIFTSDHGEMGGAHGLRQKGGVLYRESVNVPMIVSHPEGPKGATTEAVGSHLDLAPTLLSIAGVSEEERNERYPDLHGEDLSGVIASPEQDGPRGSPSTPGKGALYTYDMLSTIDIDWLAEVASQTVDLGEEGDSDGEGEDDEEKGRLRKALEMFGDLHRPDFDKRRNLRGIFDGRYKLVRYFSLDGYNLPKDVEELRERNDIALYDLVEDPGELENIANPEHPHYDEGLVAEMSRRLNALIRDEIGSDRTLVKRPLLKIVSSTIGQKLRQRF